MNKSYFKFLLALLLFGSNGLVASKIALSSYEIVFLRTLIGSTLLCFLFFLTKGKLTFFKYKKQACYLAISGIAMGASWMFLYEAYQQIGVSTSSLAYYCGPIIVILLSPLLFHEKLTKTKVFSFMVVMIGMLFLNGNLLKNPTNIWGLFCGSMSALMYAFMVIFNKKSTPIVGFENAMLQLLISFITVAVFIGFKQGLIIYIPADSILPILILGLINTGIGCYLYFSSVSSLPVQTVAICGYLEPLSAVVLSVTFLHEILSTLQLFGAILIIGGALCGELYLQFHSKQKIIKW